MEQKGIKADSAQREKIKCMTRFLILLITIGAMASCRSTKKIQKAISKKDTAVIVSVPPLQKDASSSKTNDTVLLIQKTLSSLAHNQINYTTFSGKVNIDYRGGDGKSYNINANIKMYRDSAIWISANAILGIEAMRVLITKDSVKLLDKLSKTYTARSVNYLQEVTALPLNLSILQNLIVGNPVFLDSNIVSYSAGHNLISLLSIGDWFKNLITLDAGNKTLLHSKLDDADKSRNRTADLTYSNYDQLGGTFFSTRRRIIIAEKKRLDIRMDFRQYDFNRPVNFSFPIPRNYNRD